MKYCSGVVIMKKKFFKTISMIFCIIMIILSVGCKKEEASKEKPAKAIKIVCEDTVSPMVNDLVRDYNLNNESQVTVEYSERESAFNKLYNDEVSVLIGYFDPQNKEIESDPLAYDGVGIIVNDSNKLDSVSTEELRKIYTGDISNWEKLKGPSQPIVPVAYKNTTNLATQEFNTKLMETPIKESMGKSTAYVSSVEEMKNFVAKDKNSIGFIPGQWYNKETKFLKLNGIEITISNIKNELYALRFPIKIYYSKEKKDSLKDVLQYFKSEDAKKIIRKYSTEAF